MNNKRKADSLGSIELWKLRSQDSQSRVSQGWELEDSYSDSEYTGSIRMKGVINKILPRSLQQSFLATRKKAKL